jgi:transcription elongation factor SPT5
MEGDDIEDDIDEMDEEEIQLDLPTKNDPKLWLLKCKRGMERQACMSLMLKSIDHAKKKIPLSILSCTCSDTVPDYIYIEAYKEIHVR